MAGGCGISELKPLRRKHFPEAMQKSMKASSTKGNPIQLTEGELLEILGKAI